MDGSHQNIPVEVRSWLGRQLFEHVPSNIVVIDKEFRVVIANNNFKEVFGDPDGRYCYEVYKRRNKVCDQCLAAKTFKDGKIRINDEAGVDRKGKQAHYVVYTAPIFNEAGQIAYVIEMSHDVTETKSLQGIYNLLFERVPCYVAVINRDLKIVRANEMLRDTFGKTSGVHCYEALKRCAEPCPDCPAIKTFNDGQPYQSRQVGTDKNGNLKHYIVSTTPLARSGKEFDYIIEMSTDVTDVHDLTEHLLRESSFRQILIDNTLEALIAADTTGVVTVFNQAAEELFGESAERRIGRLEGDRFWPNEFVSAIEQGQSTLSIAETEIINSKGEEIPVRFSGSVLRDGDEIIGWAAFFQDLREIKRLEQENLDNERLATVGQTVAQLAHGIKNILNGLEGGMYIIKSGMKTGSPQKLERGWGMLERNVDRITDLVKGFLNFSKGHAPVVQLSDPNHISREVFNLYHDSAEQKGIELRFEPQGEMEHANFDPEDIHTCLANLVANAIDACQTSDTENCVVTIRTCEENGQILFEVRDTGCGMDYQIKNKVFTTFFTTKGLGGNGLGLLVTKKIVQGHGGHIEVDSTPGSGSTFRMKFPRERLPQLGVTEQQEVTAQGEAADRGADRKGNHEEA